MMNFVAVVFVVTKHSGYVAVGLKQLIAIVCTSYVKESITWAGTKQRSFKKPEEERGVSYQLLMIQQ
jgi:hypothetical protein